MNVSARGNFSNKTEDNLDVFNANGEHVGDIHSRFLSQLAYNSEILSKFALVNIKSCPKVAHQPSFNL